MDPAYGDGKRRRGCVPTALSRHCVSVCVSDLWAGGFSSEEEDENGGKKSNEDLDLLASLVEEREGEGEGGRERGGEGETFEEALTKPDDVSLMRSKSVYS